VNLARIARQIRENVYTRIREIRDLAHSVPQIRDNRHTRIREIGDLPHSVAQIREIGGGRRSPIHRMQAAISRPSVVVRGASVGDCGPA
jgi:hypothetical protein